MSPSTMLLSFLIVSVCWSPNLFGLDQKTIGDRTQHLRRMSPIERDRFNRNLEEFQKLSTAEKDRYRKLHQELVDDTSRAGGLAKLLQTYAVWVQTLTPTQRDELQKETNPAQKLALIRRFKDEQDDPSEPHDQQISTNVPDDEPSPQISLPIGKREALFTPDLKAVMTVLVNRLNQDQTKPEFAEPRLADYIPILHASVQSSGTDYRDWPNETLLKEMMAVLGKESLLLVNRPDSKSKRDATIRLLLMGIMKQARDSVRFPTDAEKMQIWQDLSDSERERIVGLPYDRMNQYLIRKSMELKGENSLANFKKLPEYSRQIEDLFQRFEVSPPAKFLQRGKKRGNEPRTDSKRLDSKRTGRNPEDK